MYAYDMHKLYHYVVTEQCDCAFCVLQTCYDWFCKGIGDLEPDTQSQLFQKEILKLDLNKLTPTGVQLDKFR